MSDEVRALVLSRQWEWWPQMGVHWYQDAMIGWLPAIVVESTIANVVVCYDGKHFTLAGNDADLRPNIEDAATKGILLRELRKAVGTDDVTVHRGGSGWVVSYKGLKGSRRKFIAPTEGLALVAALTTAWKRSVRREPVLPRVR